MGSISKDGFTQRDCSRGGRGFKHCKHLLKIIQLYLSYRINTKIISWLHTTNVFKKSVFF